MVSSANEGRRSTALSTVDLHGAQGNGGMIPPHGVLGSRSLLLALVLVVEACGGRAATASNGKPGAPEGGNDAGYGGYSGVNSNDGGYSGINSQVGLSAVELMRCDSPTVDPLTHYVRCSDGVLHRPEGVVCPVLGSAMVGDPGADNGGSSSADSGVAGEAGISFGGARAFSSAGGGPLPPNCKSDADCSAMRFGYCSVSDHPEGRYCTPGCQQDSDCEFGTVCQCDGTTPGRCALAGCKGDSDCGSASLCVVSTGQCGQPVLKCLTVDDQCRADADCAAVDPHSKCVVYGNGRSCRRNECGGSF